MIKLLDSTIFLDSPRFSLREPQMYFFSFFVLKSVCLIPLVPDSHHYFLLKRRSDILKELVTLAYIVLFKFKEQAAVLCRSRFQVGSIQRKGPLAVSGPPLALQ